MPVTGHTSAHTVAEMAALGKMLYEHRPALLAMLERRIDPKLANRMNAEDLLSEAFLEARRKWDWFKDQSGLSAYVWLYRICLDTIIAAWRRESRQLRDVRRDMPLPDQSSICLGLGLIHSGTSPSASMVREEMQQQMRQVMSMLKPNDQEILWMRHSDQLAFAEISMVLGISENAASVRYVRALRKLKIFWTKFHSASGEES